MTALIAAALLIFGLLGIAKVVSLLVVSVVAVCCGVLLLASPVLPRLGRRN